MTVPRRLMLAALCVGLFLVLLVGLDTGFATPIDTAINASLAPVRTPAVLAGFLWLTTIGTEASRFAMILTVSALLWSEKRNAPLHQLWTTVLGSETTVWIAKFLIDRPRPAFLPGVATALSPSFPSAHSAGTMAVVGAVAVIVARRRPGRGGLVGTLAAVLIAAIGLSRLVLNVHYPTDVASGFLVGACWVLLGSVLGERSVEPI